MSSKQLLRDRLKGLSANANSPARTSVRKRIVLIVDDDVHVLSSLRAMLDREYEVRTTSDAEEGVRLALESDVALVVLDVKMPHRDGFWVFDRIRKTRARLPIVFHTAFQDQHTADEVKRRVGEDYVIVKGTSVRDFMAHIRRLVRECASVVECEDST